MSKTPSALSWEFLQNAALVYFALPALIFLLFWFASPWNIIFALLAGYAMRKSFGSKETVAGDSFSYSYSWAIWLFVAVCILSLVFGVGGVMPQEDDYEKTNAFFNGLRSLYWPWGAQFTDGKTVTMIYYFGYIILPALGGAVAGDWGMMLAAFLVTTFGLWLGLICLGKYFKLPTWALFVFLGFNGLSFTGTLLQPDGFAFHQFYGLWSWPLVNVSMIETYFCSPHHLITPLILLPLVLRALDNKRYDWALIWLALGLYWSPLTTVGIGLFALWGARKAVLKELITFRNVAAFLGLVFPILVFFSARLYPDHIVALWSYPWVMRKVPLFLFLEFGVWLLFIGGRYWRDSRTWVAVIAFVVLTFFTMGQWLDLLFRTGLPWRIFLFAMVLKSLEDTPRLSFRIPFAIIYLLGVIAPLTFTCLQFCDKEHPALTGFSPHEYKGYLLRLDYVLKQYFGDKRVNPIANALLKEPPAPVKIPGKYTDMEIYSYVIGSCQLFDSLNRPYYIYKGKSQFASFWVNHDGTRLVQLSFDIENKTGRPIQMEFLKHKDTDATDYWHYYTALESLQGDFIKAASENMPDQWSRISVPAKGCRITAITRLLSGVTEFALIRDPREEKDVRPSDEIFRIKNMSLRITDQGTPEVLHLEELP